MIAGMTEILDPVMPAITRNQRIVLEHTCGPYAGLHQIVGHSDQHGGQQPPALTEPFTITPGERMALASLVKSTPRFLLYRELTVPEGLGRFDRAQR